MTVGGMGFIPERLLMMMMMIYQCMYTRLPYVNTVHYTVLSSLYINVLM